MSSANNNDDEMNEENNLPPNEWNTPSLGQRTIVKKSWKCGHCGLFGHNKRTCPTFLNQGKFGDDHSLSIGRRA